MTTAATRNALISERECEMDGCSGGVSERMELADLVARQNRCDSSVSSLDKKHSEQVGKGKGGSPSSALTMEDWRLPAGAEHIVKTIAAEHILMDLLNHFGRTTNQAGGSSKEGDTVDFDAIESILRQYPRTCHVTYQLPWYHGQTRQLYPLSVLACLPKAPLSLVKLAYQLYPDAIDAPEPTTTALALDYACSYEASLEVVQFLVEHSAPHVLSTARHEQLLPLHLACHFGASVDVVRYLLQAYPAAIHNCESEGWYPLHTAAAGRAPVSVVQLLYEAQPEAAVAQDSGQSTPLHIACTNQAPLPVIEFLLEHAPQTMNVPDVDTLTPLFRAVRNPINSLAMVRYLLDWRNRRRTTQGHQRRHRQADEVDRNNDDLDNNHLPHQIATVDAFGGTLLHHAISGGQQPIHPLQHELLSQAEPSTLVELVEYLCATFPHFVRARTADPDQFLPLHVACLFAGTNNNATTLLQVVQVLIRHAPDSVHIRDGHGRTPLALVSASSPAYFQPAEEEDDAGTADLSSQEMADTETVGSNSNEDPTGSTGRQQLYQYLKQQMLMQAPHPRNNKRMD